MSSFEPKTRSCSLGWGKQAAHQKVLQAVLKLCGPCERTFLRVASLPGTCSDPIKAINASTC